MYEIRFIHKWKANRGIASQCQIQAFAGVGRGLIKTVVIASDSISKGCSITNQAEIIATDIVKKLSINPVDLVYIEHNVKTEGYSEEYDLLSFDWDSAKQEMQNPVWNPLTRAKVERIVGRSL